MEEQNQEFLFKLSMFDQQIRQMQQQIKAVDDGIVELESLNIDLDDMKNSEGKEILAPIGRGIFAKAKLVSEEFLVDVGDRNFVKKSVDETKVMIKKQVEKLQEIRKELDVGLEQLSKEIEKVIAENEKK